MEATNCTKAQDEISAAQQVHVERLCALVFLCPGGMICHLCMFGLSKLFRFDAQAKAKQSALVSRFQKLGFWFLKGHDGCDGCRYNRIDGVQGQL